MGWDQWAIALLTPAGIVLSQLERTAKYGCLVSIAAQPFWFWSAWQAEQWGAFFACFVALAAWSVGLYTYWWKPPPKELSEFQRQRLLNIAEGADIADRLRPCTCPVPGCGKHWRDGC